MNDRELRDALYGLGLDEQSLPAVALLPLVEVAWADGRIQKAERTLILDVARERGGLSPDGEALLETWLRYRPSDRYLNQGRQVLAALAHRGHGEGGVTARTLEEVVALCSEVAEAAGGVFGRIGAIDPAEKAAINEIASALSLTRRPSWDDLVTDLNAAEAAIRRRAARRAPEDDDGLPEVTDPFAEPSQALEVVGGHGVAVQRAAAPAASDRERPALLLLMRDGHEADRFPFTGHSLSIGRRSDNDVAIPEDARVSRLHCRLFREGPRVTIADCASASGTWVQGERVHARRLYGGEEIVVGQTSFQFLFAVIAG